jgi:hypothetical protein
MARFHEQKEAEKNRDERDWERTSVLWSAIVNMAGKVSKKNVKPSDLLKKSTKEKPKLMSPKEVDELFKKNVK